MSCPAANQSPPCAAGCSRAQGPSGASPARSSAHRTPGATDNTSPRSPRSGGLRPPCSGPARPEHRPAAASQRSLQACIASLPLQSSWMSKTYLKSDHFNGGGSATITQGESYITQGAMAQTSGNTTVTYLAVGTDTTGGTPNVGALNVSGGTISFGTGLQVGDFAGRGALTPTRGASRGARTYADPAHCRARQ